MLTVQNHPEGVSLVICSYNGAARIGKVLEYIQQQAVPDTILWEVILVDNASTDNIADVAFNSWKLKIPFKIVSEPQPGLMNARNRGVREAAFEYITFIDDDNLIAHDWVENVYNAFSGNREIGMCGGKNHGIYDVSPPPWLLKIESSLAVGKQGKQSGDITDSRGYLWGAGLSLRKTIYEKIMNAGFKPVLSGRSGGRLTSGEDMELCLAFRIYGLRLYYLDNLTLQHIIPVSRMEWEYAVNLFREFGRAEFTLELYRMEMNNTKMPFLNLYLGLIPYSILYFGWRFLNHFRIREGNIRYLSYLARKAYIVTALKNIGNFRQIYGTIRNFKQSIKEV